MNFDIKAGLRDLGFSDKKSAIFLALLTLGDATAGEIAKTSRLKRTTVYNLLPELIAEGYVKTIHRKGKQAFYVEDVRSLLTPVIRMEQSVRQALPHLQALHNVLPLKPKVTFYEGESGAIDFWMKTLDVESGSTIYEMVGPEAFYTKLPEVIAASYVAERIERRIRIKMIATDSGATRRLQKDAEKELREIVVLPESVFDAATVIFGNKVGFISFAEDFSAVIMESKAISSMQRTTFELFWNMLTARATR